LVNEHWELIGCVVRELLEHGKLELCTAVGRGAARTRADRGT